jgi:hypothetical protein
VRWRRRRGPSAGRVPSRLSLSLSLPLPPPPPPTPHPPPPPHQARALKTQLAAESKRASSLDRLLQTYARDAYKRVGYDQVAGAQRTLKSTLTTGHSPAP